MAARRCSSTDRGRLVGQVTKGGAGVRQKVLDLDDDLFGPIPSNQVDVDRARARRGVVDRELRPRQPAAYLREADHQLLPTQVLDVPQERRPGSGLDEGRQLRVDGGRARSQGVEGGVDEPAPLDPAPCRLTDACPGAGIRLVQAKRAPGFTEPDADAAGNRSRSVTCEPLERGASSTIAVRRPRIVSRSAYPRVASGEAAASGTR